MAKKIATDLSDQKVVKKRNERTGLPLEIIVESLQAARNQPTREERKQVLHEINGELWKPTYQEVREALKTCPETSTISDWVLKGI